MEKSNWLILVTTLITVGGTIAVAVINQQGKADKTEPRDPPIVRDTTVKVDGTQAVVDTVPVQKFASPEAARTEPPPVVSPALVAAQPPPAVLDISGAWHDTQHATYIISQQGGAIRIGSPQYPAGIGGGTIIGNVVQWEYRDNNGTPGRCGGVAAGGQLQIVCSSMGVDYPYPLHRPSSG